jgi:hypothetical protein
LWLEDVDLDFLDGKVGKVGGHGAGYGGGAEKVASR